MPTHYQGTERDRAALNAYINLVRASETILARLAAQLGQKGLTLGQFGALEALWHLGPMSQRELGRKLLRTGGNVTYVLNHLERRGWVRRETVQDDRRKFLVRLTPAGRVLIARIFPRHVLAVTREFARLSMVEQRTLRRLCRKLGRGDVQEATAR